MIQFDKPQNLNGAELKQELRAAGIQISDAYDSVAIDGNGVLLLDINAKDEAKAKSIVAAHDGNVIPKELTVEEKLEIVGLNVNDLKTALGL